MTSTTRPSDPGAEELRREPGPACQWRALLRLQDTKHRLRQQMYIQTMGYSSAPLAQDSKIKMNSVSPDAGEDSNVKMNTISAL